MSEGAWRRVRVPTHELAGTVLALSVPQNWEKAAREISGSRPGWVLLVAYTPSTTVEIDVFQARQAFEVNLTDWMEYQAELLKLKLTVVKSVKTEFGRMAHAAAVDSNGDRLRFVVAGDGPNLFLQAGRAAATEPQATLDLLDTIADSFGFSKFSGQRTREEMARYTAPGLGVELLYPKSWTAAPRKSRFVAVDFRIGQGPETLAYAHVVRDAGKAAGAAGLRGALDDALAEARNAGIAIENLQKIPGTEASALERYTGLARVPAGDDAVFLTLRADAQGWLRSLTVAPSKDRGRMIWMRAKRFDEAIVASFRKA